MLSARPAISKGRKLALLLRAVSGKAAAISAPRPQERKSLDARGRRSINWSAYATCRAIAKREAKNFYYAFVALPEPRRNAICAIYAFMRQADDLADDETFPARAPPSSGSWLADWRSVCTERRPTIRFSSRSAMPPSALIPLDLLDELVAGVTMDLEI